MGSADVDRRGRQHHSNGLYTAPASPPIINYGGGAGQQGVVTVFASVIYPSPGTLFGSAASSSQTFVITAPTVTTGITPATATVPLGGTIKFQPYAVGSTNRGYILQVNGMTGGSLTTGTMVSDNTNAGLYTAPTVMPMTGNMVAIMVISQADPARPRPQPLRCSDCARPRKLGRLSRERIC